MYAGATYRIPCAAGGNNYSPNANNLGPEAMVDPSKNINMHLGGRTKRGGTAHYDLTAIPGGPQILNGYDYRKKDGNRFIMRHAADGALYRDNVTAIQTGLASSGRPCFETFLDNLYLADGISKPQIWDGIAATTTDLATPPPDWTADHQPKYVLKHGIGASQRMWYLGVNNHLDRLYYSVLGDGQDLTGTGSGQFSVETTDGFGLTGAVEFGARLLAFGRTKTFLIDDSDPDVANWGVVPAQWEGGVAHHNLLVKTPNDLVAMQEDGEIYSVTAVQSYGDYKAASIARPAFIHAWIKENINLSQIGSFHAIYDHTLRAIKFFVVRNGMSEVDTALVYFIDRPPNEAWQIHDNIVSPSGYSASCAFEVREVPGTYAVFTGDYDGFLWKLEQDAKNDDGAGYVCQSKTPPMTFENPRVLKKYRRGKIIFANSGSYNINLRWWVDGIEQPPRIVVFSNLGGVYDSALYDNALYSGPAVAEADFALGAIGKRLELQLENSVADQEFFISEILIDNEVLGARAK